MTWILLFVNFTILISIFLIQMNDFISQYQAISILLSQIDNQKESLFSGFIHEKNKQNIKKIIHLIRTNSFFGSWKKINENQTGKVELFFRVKPSFDRNPKNYGFLFFLFNSDYYNDEYTTIESTFPINFLSHYNSYDYNVLKDSHSFCYTNKIISFSNYKFLQKISTRQFLANLTFAYDLSTNKLNCEIKFEGKIFAVDMNKYPNNYFKIITKVIQKYFALTSLINFSTNLFILNYLTNKKEESLLVKIFLYF